MEMVRTRTCTECFECHTLLLDLIATHSGKNLINTTQTQEKKTTHTQRERVAVNCFMSVIYALNINCVRSNTLQSSSGHKNHFSRIVYEHRAIVCVDHQKIFERGVECFSFANEMNLLLEPTKVFWYSVYQLEHKFTLSSFCRNTNTLRWDWPISLILILLRRRKKTAEYKKSVQKEIKIILYVNRNT